MSAMEESINNETLIGLTDTMEQLEVELFFSANKIVELENKMRDLVAQNDALKEEIMYLKQILTQGNEQT